MSPHTDPSSVVRKIVRDPSQSAEVTQEIFVEVCRTATRFEARRGSPKTWVLTMAHRRAIDRVRSEQASRERTERIGEVVPSNEVAAAEDLQTWEAEVPGGGSARIVYSATRGEGWFLADGLESVEARKVYELWLIDDEGPSPAGLFNPTDGVAANSFTGDVSQVAAMAVSVEPASGSPQPTSDPIIVVDMEDQQAQT